MYSVSCCEWHTGLRFANHCFLFLFTFYTASPLFLESGLYNQTDELGIEQRPLVSTGARSYLIFAPIPNWCLKQKKSVFGSVSQLAPVQTFSLWIFLFALMPLFLFETYCWFKGLQDFRELLYNDGWRTPCSIFWKPSKWSDLVTGLSWFSFIKRSVYCSPNTFCKNIVNVESSEALSRLISTSGDVCTNGKCIPPC